MRSNLKNLLYDRYPRLYRQKDDSISTTAMVWGFEHGDGWFSIVDGLSAVLADVDPEAEASQVKEKFGTLHFYAHAKNKAAYAAINAAEAYSARVCEITGRPGVLVSERGWFSTMSPEARLMRSTESTQTRMGDQEETHEYGWSSRLPEFDKKQAFSKDEAFIALRKRHLQALARTRKIDFPCRLFDLVDVAVQEISGDQQRKPGTKVVEISEIFWSQSDGLVIIPSFLSMRTVAREKIESARERALKFNRAFEEPSLAEVLHQTANEVAAVASFALEMAMRTEVQTGRCGPVDDHGKVIDLTSSEGGGMPESMDNTGDVFMTVTSFQCDNIFEPTVFCRKEIKATLKARESVAELIRNRSIIPLLPRIYWQHELFPIRGVRPAPVRVARALAREYNWRVALPVEMSQFFMGRITKPDVRQIDTFLYDQDMVREYSEVGLKLKPVVDRRLLELTPAGQAIWHHIHTEPRIPKKLLMQDARFAASAWFCDPLIRGWLVADVQSGRLEDLELFLAQAIMSAFEEDIGIAREAPSEFDPAYHDDTAARIFRWELVESGGLVYLMAQHIENHTHIADGDSLARSTPLVWIDEKLGWARTRSRYYRLMGERLR